jgi:hypothetical protein
MFKFFIVMLLFDMLLSFSELGNKPHENMSFNFLHIIRNALQHRLKAIYPASVELSAISVCRLLNQCIVTLASTLINHVRDRHTSCRCANS